MASPSRKRSHSEMGQSAGSVESRSPSNDLFDQAYYTLEVRRIPHPFTEIDWENDLQRLALNEGIRLPSKLEDTEVEAIDSSMSGVTITSDNTNMQSSIMSQSTAPTSCSSSERRPMTQGSMVSETSAPAVQPSVLSPTSSKRNSVFRARMRKIVRLKKKEQASGSPASTSPEASDVASPVDSEVQLQKEPVEDAPSIRSQKSEWSGAALPKPSFDAEVDAAALKQSPVCQEMVDRRKEQLEERDRFVGYRRALLDQLTHEREKAKSERKAVQDAALEVKEAKDQQDIDELENKHLAEELRMAEEHKFREQMMNSRLRRIERFVHNPTPPPAQAYTASTSPTGAPEDASRKTTPDLPTRTTGPADYNHLAEQYREQKNLVHVNVAKINVLRGHQQKRLDALLERKQRELEAVEEEHDRELAAIDQVFGHKEKALNEIFQSKRLALELHWYRYATYEQERKEKSTGLKFPPLPPVTVE
ncbi:uncharacterized protein HMPREF1541_00809 [Cyphellophora europaea CBS 101466]|uniref:Uncharacterized protein n=1 Tax=Cyphellophora europaea (strain CBS 101466) TaxID=1220924 RepID=W2SF12_CYPE1|nr:uncharacterized protein HMPREF1541_00809 [Cyphellophora europaea CBS 101466]ETN46623.1 hypothetical protein HMPREF1541_00809 [Cyphellophora europaea CBS 101466]